MTTNDGDGWAELLAAGCPEGVSVSPAVADSVLECWLRARERWPAVDVPRDVYGPYVMARVQEREAIASRHTDDLYLACGCAFGDKRAIAALEADVLPNIDQQLAKIAGDAATAEDLQQTFRCKLLVGDEIRPPRIASFDGHGSLFRWLKVVAVREALMDKRRRRMPATEDGLAEMAAPDGDVDLHYMQARYGEQFRNACERALGELAPLDRTLLRYHLVDRMSIDQIAAIDGSHRATAARRLARIRTRLQAAIKTHLMEELAVGTSELASIMRMIRSNVDISVHRLLCSRPS